MRRKYIVISILVLVIVFLLVFRNIVFAFISSSERIDRHMLSVMVQGAISPTKEFVLDGNGEAITIPLPKGAAEIDRNTFLIPSSEFMEYLMFLEKLDGYTVENSGQLYYSGASIAVEVEGKILFHINVNPYAGAYMKFRYSH